jgi:hypothetical protein
LLTLSTDEELLSVWHKSARQEHDDPKLRMDQGTHLREIAYLDSSIPIAMTNPAPPIAASQTQDVSGVHVFLESRHACPYPKCLTMKKCLALGCPPHVNNKGLHDNQIVVSSRSRHGRGSDPIQGFGGFARDNAVVPSGTP